MTMKGYNALLIVALLIVEGCTATRTSVEDLYDGDPLAIVLTWQQDPATTMTIDWHTRDNIHTDTMWYRQSGETEWYSEEASSHPFPYSPRIIHRVELTGLASGSDYEFTFGRDDRIFSFRTMPADEQRPIRFVAGGDVMHKKEWMEKTNREAAKYDPDFIVWGGDLAYADGKEKNLNRWYKFLDAMRNTLILPDGRVIPVIVAIGNHEVRRGYYHRHADAAEDDSFREQISPYFYGLFAFPGQPGYNVLDFGENMSIVVLDSGHNNPVGGRQTEWLAHVLQERKNITHIFPVYHVPAYPGTGSFSDRISSQIRYNWVPLFETYNMRVVFENHDHLYKRTYPMKNEEIDSTGVVYIGGGAWGVRTRHPRGLLRIGRRAEYLKETASKRHFNVVTIDGTHQHFLVVNNYGEIIDEYSIRN